VKKQVITGFIGILLLSCIPLLTPTLHIAQHLERVPITIQNAIPSKAEFILVYVGYAGCNTECPKTLSSLAQLKKVTESIPVYMIDLLNASDLNSNYAAQFHPKFKTVAKNDPFLAELGAWWKSEQINDKVISHSDRLYLIYVQNNKFTLINHYKGSSDAMGDHLLKSLERLQKL
jgi:protein SCO1/2